jgi:starch synthase
MNVLYAVGEANPFIATGGLGDVAGSLPQKIREKLNNCRVVLPFYSDIPDSMRAKAKFITNFTVSLSWRQQYCGLFEAHIDGNIYYFLDNEYYFKRNGIYGHYDDGERFAFFSKAVLDMLQHINFSPDIIHANDWHTALIPTYKKLLYDEIKGYQNIKTVFTIHNIIYQGQFSLNFYSDVIGLKDEHKWALEYNGCINLMKSAIVTADAITTVSPSYSKEILDSYYSNGLDEILRSNESKLTGIINGIDTDKYDPETDESIFKNYSAHDMTGKLENRTALQKLFNLPTDTTIPLIGMVSRLVDNKGFDLVRAAAEDILCNKSQMIILGTGDTLNERFLQDLANRYPGKMAVKIGFFPDIARKIYAGSDLFLMPSKSEPCGLSQMIALRYGTIPIVRETGGLKDTIIDCANGNGNGFTFKDYEVNDLIKTVRRAEDYFKQKDRWEALVKRALDCDYCWQNSADQYINLYTQLK